MTQSNILFSNSNIKDVLSTNKDASIYFSHSNVQNIANILISEVNQLTFLASTSVLNNVNNLVIKNCSQGIKLIELSSAIIFKSQFVSLGSSKQYNGAGLYVENSNLTITDILFENNLAQYGAAIDLSCDLKTFCTYSISSSNFTNNSAIYYGGSIRYDLYRPNFSNNLFESNSAKYGLNIASYPIKIKIKNSSTDSIQLTNVGSGVKYDSSIELALVDFDDQINQVDDSSIISIKSFGSNKSVSGSTIKKVVNGTAVFNDLIFTSSPGETNVDFIISSESLNSQRINKVISNYSQNPIQISFRYCMPGEIIQNNECVECSPGTYSFIWNSTQCNSCMSNAVCLGGVSAYGYDGYWRLNKNASIFYECMNPKACNGGFNESSEYPVNCAVGYEGVLCAQCSTYNDEKYENTGNYKCSKCPDPTLNAIRVVGLIILALLFFIVQIIMILRKKEESQNSILMRILTNYLQVTSAVLSFNIKFPTSVSDIFYPMNQLGSTSQPFVSFDCFARHQKLVAFTPSTSIFKILLSSMLPLVAFTISIIIWPIIGIILRKWRLNLKRNILVSNIVSLFILHPTITKSFLSLFQCVKISPEESRVNIDVNILCYSMEHILWCCALGVPSILIWSIGIPLFAFSLLFKHRHNLEDTEIKTYYLMIYQGLRPEKFYWEFINTIKKLLILCTNAFLSTYSLFFRILPLTIVLVSFYRLQLKLSPYKNPANNHLERIETLAEAFMLYGGIIYINDTIF